MLYFGENNHAIVHVVIQCSSGILKLFCEKLQ